MKASVHAYASRRSIDACIITKLDEAASLGESLSVVVEHALPVSYITNGQEIPKDIAKATAKGLVGHAVKLMKHLNGSPEASSMHLV